MENIIEETRWCKKGSQVKMALSRACDCHLSQSLSERSHGYGTFQNASDHQCFITETELFFNQEGV